MTKKATTTNKNKKNSTQKTPAKTKQAKKKTISILGIKRINKKVAVLVAVFFGILFIFSSYAWFSTNLNVKVKMFKLSVSKNSDLSISFDGINYDYTIELTQDFILNELENTYPTHNSQWNANGFIPVSSRGVTNPNDPRFEFYETSGVLYKKKKIDDGFLYTKLATEETPRKYNSYIAFDVFIKNKNGSPRPDNLYFNGDTSIVTLEDIEDEMLGLVNSFRVGVVKVGSADLEATPEELQAITCNNDCKSIIYEPNSKNHTELSIERAKKFDVDLVDGIEFPTYAYKKAGGPIYLYNSVSGSPNIDEEYFELQETITEDDFNEPLFTIPNAVTKVRIYIWIEGQDIDSLETHSDGTEVDINLSFIKDTEGWNYYNEK